MPLYRMCGLAVALVWLTLLSAVAAENPEHPLNHIEYWQKNYDELRPQDDARADRTHKIFQRVVQAAGTRPGVVPRLFITTTDPLNVSLPMAIPGGWIILSRSALERCYRDPAQGDDRLAFVLAHEIAHQLKGDFWHMQFFQAIEASKAQAPQQKQLWEEVRSIASRTADVLAKELQADEQGIMYAAMAGFNTDAIVTYDDRVNFFADWVQALDPTRLVGAQSDSSHPTPQQRAATIKASLQRVLTQVDVFRWGLRFYQAGDYLRATDAFEDFLRVFPSREVYHNLATSYHQLALKAYRRWKQDDTAIPFQRSLAIEPVTRAEPRRGGSGSPEQEFQDHITKAIEFYRRAKDLDPTYVRSRNNLGCALLLTEDVYGAIAILQEALKIAPDLPETLNNLGVAFAYADKPSEAQAYLAKAHELAPTYEAPLFNLGRLAYAAHKTEATEYWLAYLALDPGSAWAKTIREALALSTPTPTAPSVSPVAVEQVAGMEVGPFPKQLPPGWGQPKTTRLPFADPLTVAEYSNGVLLLVQTKGEKIRMIIAQEGFVGHSARGIAIGSAEAEVRTQYGHPSRIVPTAQGVSWIYAQGIAFQMREGKVVSWQVF
jgi:tetratricopeptide (TPR) repeat protein